MLQKIAHPEQHVARGPHLLHDLVKEAAQRRANATEASHGRLCEANNLGQAAGVRAETARQQGGKKKAAASCDVGYEN